MMCPSWRCALLGAALLFSIGTFTAAQVRIVDSFNDSGILWKRLSMNESQPFWYNTQTGESIWNDPRGKKSAIDVGDPFQGGLRPLPPMQASPRDSLVQSSLLVLGVMGIIFGSIAARWTYLYQHSPELLFPTKARKQRRRENNKMKQRRQRFKVSQDGKGGSSRNS